MRGAGKCVAPGWRIAQKTRTLREVSEQRTPWDRFTVSSWTSEAEAEAEAEARLTLNGEPIDTMRSDNSFSELPYLSADTLPKHTQGTRIGGEELTYGRAGQC
jgi:hypothetical protein